MTTQDLRDELQRAAALIEMGRFGEGANHAQRILGFDPANAHAAALVSQAALGLRDYQRALDAARLATSLAPEWAWPHQLASSALSGTGDREMSIREAQEALRLDPENPSVHIRLGEELIRADRSLEARAHITRAQELAPTAVGPAYLTGRLARAEGRHEDAEAAFEHALSIDPDHAPSHNEIARMRLGRGPVAGFRAGALADAVGGFATAIRANPQDEVIRRNLDIATVRFLQVTAYFVFLAAFFGARLTSGKASGSDRNLPLIFLALPVVYGVRFVLRLRPQMRRFLLDLVLHRPAIGIATALLLGSVGLIIGEALTTHGPRGALAVAAVLLALGARVLLWRHRSALRGAGRPAAR